jgi:hypothetical protein
MLIFNGRMYLRIIYLLVANLVMSAIPLSALNAEECLKFGYSNLQKPQSIIGPNFYLAMKEAGICVELFPRPVKRGNQDLKNGTMDGAVSRVPSFKDIIGNDAVMITEPLVSAAGLLVSFDPNITTIASLAGRRLAIIRGIKWPLNLVGDMKTIEVSKYQHMVNMLKINRFDAILIDGLSAKNFKSELAGATMTKLVNLSGHPWIRTSLKHRASDITNAIRAYRAKGRTFLDPLPKDN